MLKEKFHIAVPTAFNANESLNIELTIKYIEGLKNKGIKSVLVCGSTGEQHSMLLHEKLELIKALNSSDLVSDMEIIFGVSSIRESDAIQLANEISLTDISGILLGFPPYILPAQDEAVRYAKKIIRTANKPVILYNNPKRTGFDLSIESALELMKEINVIGLKEAGAPEKVTELSKLSQNKNFYFYAGGEVNLDYKIKLGFNALSSMLGNIDPNFIKNYYESLYNNSFINEDDKKNLETLIDLFFNEKTLVNIKKHLNKDINIIGICRKPLGN